MRTTIEKETKKKALFTHLRPLLFLSKQYIKSIIKIFNIEHFIDYTNKDSSVSRRNYFRALFSSQKNSKEKLLASFRETYKKLEENLNGNFVPNYRITYLTPFPLWK